MPFEPLGNFFYAIIGFIDAVLVPLIFTLAFVAFIWGVFRYFIAGGADKEKREEGRKFVLWSVIGFVVMFSIWGIVSLLINSLGFDNNSRPGLPLFGGQQNYNQDWNNNNNQQNGQSCGLLSIPPFWICPDGKDCVSNVCVDRDGT